jgi:hyperosmotically inducible protein
MKTFISLVFAIVPLAALSQQAPATGSHHAEAQMSQRGTDRIVKEVHHELALLPYYGIFDKLGYKVSPDGTVTLVGQVIRPTTKSDAENSVKHIEGVERVDNQIQVLPLSPNDDHIRRDAYRAIYGNPALSEYAMRSVAPIHIIVDNGNITLEGAVSRPMDKQIAEMQAKGVPGAFSVNNHLQIENP